MPQQPLSRVAPAASIMMNNVGDYPLRRHPILAILIAEVISSWATVEAFMQGLFVDLMGGQGDKAATMFLALDIQSAKTAAITAVANATLSERELGILRAILDIIKSRQKDRDKIAHGVWGDSPQLPDALLLVHPKAALVSGYDRKEIFAYKERDFLDIIRGNERLAGYGMDFRFLITAPSARVKDQLYQKLSSEAEIRDVVSRRASRGQSPPSKCAPPPDAFHQDAYDEAPELPD